MTHRVLTAVLAAVALLAPLRAGGAQRSSSHHVLVVAHNNSLDKGVRPLRFADDDGARYWELFSEVTPHVSLLSVPDADTARIHPDAARAAKVPWLRNLRQEVARIRAAVQRANRAGKATTFTFVYVGHGNVAADGEGYVNLQDARLRRRDLFGEVVDRIPAGTVHLIIDACKSYFLVSRGPKDWRDDRSGRSYREEVRAFFSESTLEAHPHVGAILSTSGDEEVHEWSAFRSGVFSHQLRSALAGAADLNGDGMVEYSEVGAFIAAANRRVVHQRARLRPFVRPPPARLHAPLFELQHTKSDLRLELERADRGRFSVEDERGVRAIDLNKAPGNLVRLALVPGLRYFVRHRREESVLPRNSHGVVPLSSLGRGPASSGSRGSVDQAYRDNMFAVALSRSFYEGYLATTDLPAVAFGPSTEGAAPALPGRWQIDLSYALSPTALDVYDGVQHNLALGLRRDLWAPGYVALRAEFGVSRHGAGDGESISLVRIGLLASVGLAWQIRPWVEAAVEASGGYQALVTTVRDQYDPSGAKFGSQVLISFRPWRALPNLALLVRGGLYGHLFTVSSGDSDPADPQMVERVYALPEGGVGLSYGF